MKADRFLEVARRLAEGSEPEDYRSAISRAYYAVFNVAEAFLRQMEFTDPKRDPHQMMQTRLMASGDEAFIKLGSRLGDFHSQRIKADYRMGEPWPENQENARAAVLNARAMIDIFNLCAIYGERWKDIKNAMSRIPG